MGSCENHDTNSPKVAAASATMDQEMSGMTGGMGCGSHHGKSKSHKKKRRGGMGCGSHHGSKKKHKNKRSKMRRGGMGCGSHHGTKKKRKSKRK